MPFSKKVTPPYLLYMKNKYEGVKLFTQYY